MNLEITRDEFRMRFWEWFGSLRAMDASEGPHGIQVKVQLLKEVCRLTDGMRETC